MDFNENKENKIFELKSKYKALLNNLNSFSPFNRLSSLNLNNAISNDRIDFLIEENLHIQNNIDYLQKKISEKLNDFEQKNKKSIYVNNDFKNAINDDCKKIFQRDLFTVVDKPNINNDDINFLKKEVISLNNFLVQINDGINRKMDFSITELASLYESLKCDIDKITNKECKTDIPTLFFKNISQEILESLTTNIKNELNSIKDNFDNNKKAEISIIELTSLCETLKIEIEKLSNKEFKVDVPSLSTKDFADEILASLSENIKSELVIFKDNFDKKLDDLKSHFDFEPFIRENYYKLNNQSISNDVYEKNYQENGLTTYPTKDINLDQRDLGQIFLGEDKDKQEIEEPHIQEHQSESNSTNVGLVNIPTDLKNNSKFASISTLEKNLNYKDEYSNNIKNTETNYEFNPTANKTAAIISSEINSKWNTIVSNMEENIQIITEENKFLKSKFDILQKNYESLKNDYIQKNHEAINVEKILALTNHKFIELSKMLDQQDLMMKTLQEENKLFFDNFKYNKKDTNDEAEVPETLCVSESNGLISSNLKKLEEKLINIQCELNKIDNDNFNQLISEYRDKVI